MLIKLKVITEAKKEKFVKKSDDHFEISVKEPAERNLANKRVLNMVRKHLKLYNRRVKIIKGHHSPSKIIEIT